LLLLTFRPRLKPSPERSVHSVAFSADDFGLIPIYRLGSYKYNYEEQLFLVVIFVLSSTASVQHSRFHLSDRLVYLDCMSSFTSFVCLKQFVAHRGGTDDELKTLHVNKLIISFMRFVGQVHEHAEHPSV